MTNVGVPTEATPLEYFVIPIISIVIILLCLLKILHKKNQATLERQPEYLRGEELCLLDTQEIFVIYARDSELFTTMMESFKQLLRSVDKKVSVHDINVHNEAMCADPENWIRNKISNENTKFILFLNNCGIKIFENQVISGKKSKIVYKNAKWHDYMFTYAIRQLQNAMTINYTNLFVVNTIFCNTSAFDLINPGTRFVLPNTIEKLLQHVFPNEKYFNDSFLMDFNDQCRKYNQFCEENSDYANDVIKIE